MEYWKGREGLPYIREDLLKRERKTGFRRSLKDVGAKRGRGHLGRVASRQYVPTGESSLEESFWTGGGKR